MVVEEIPNRPSHYKPIYRLTLAPFDLVGGGPPDFEDKYLYDSPNPATRDKKFISHIYLHPKQMVNFKESKFFQRLEPFLEPNYKIFSLYDE